MNIFEVFATITLNDNGFNKGIDDAIAKGASFNNKFNSAMINVANTAESCLGSANAAFSKLADAANSAFSVMPDQLLRDSLDNIHNYWDDWLANRKAQIDEELSLESLRLNSIIDGINAEIAAYRNARNIENAVSNAETKLISANSAVSYAEKALVRAQAEAEFARDDNAKIEAEKLVAQKQSALSAAQDALSKAQRDYDDQLWYADKNAQIAAVQTQISDAQIAADHAKLIAEQQAEENLNNALNSLYQQQSAQNAAAASYLFAGDTAKYAALLAGSAAAAGAASISKSATINYNVLSTLTSGQIANLVTKLMEDL